MLAKERANILCECTRAAGCLLHTFRLLSLNPEASKIEETQINLCPKTSGYVVVIQTGYSVQIISTRNGRETGYSTPLASSWGWIGYSLCYGSIIMYKIVRLNLSHLRRGLK